MSLINKMLQDLDRRNAMSSAAAGALPPQQVRAVRAPDGGHEWFWRVLAVLVLIGLGWVGWVAYQLQPRPLVTDLALTAGEQARRKASAAAQSKAAAPVAEKAPAAPPAPASAISNAAPPELFKLALAIDTPITARSPKPSAKAPASGKQADIQAAPRVSKRERAAPAADEAESLFRHGVALLNQARISEAQNDFMAALFRYPQHEPARQALIATRIERRQIEEARRLLEEGLALNPAQTQFAMVLARIHVERGDYHAAAGVLTIPGEAPLLDADYQTVLGAVLQRLGRHAEAAQAFQNAVRAGNPAGVTLVALGISLEAAGRKADALQAYKRSLSEPMAQEARSYAESRLRALE